MEMHPDQEAGVEAPMDRAAQVDTLIAELEIIVQSIESDVGAGRVTDAECAAQLHRLRLRAEEMFGDF